MQIWTSSWLHALSAAAAVTAVSCAGTDDWLEQTPEPGVTAPMFQIAGTVEYLDVEGGVFVIHATDGTRYNPINLPESFRSNGMVVDAEVRRRNDLISTVMVGPLIEVIRIRPRD